MDRIRILLSRCAALFSARKLDAELDEELRTHIDLAAEENRKRGMFGTQARLQQDCGHPLPHIPRTATLRFDLDQLAPGCSPEACLRGCRLRSAQC